MTLIDCLKWQLIRLLPNGVDDDFKIKVLFEMPSYQHSHSIVMLLTKLVTQLRGYPTKENPQGVGRGGGGTPSHDASSGR